MKKFHLPLPELVYEQLRAEALLAACKKAARKEEIAAYAVEMAGTEFDLKLGARGSFLATALFV